MKKSDAKNQKPATAIYQKIADDIEEQIVSGELQSGDRIQSERELSQELGVNRLTVRRAFNVLVERGLIDRRHGGGTYVTTPRIERLAGELFPFTLGIQKLGMTPGIKKIAFEQIPADSSLAQVLAIPVSAPVYYIYRVRLINDEPALLEQFFVPVDRFPGFDQQDHENLSGYAIMDAEYGVKVVRAEQSLEPVVATAYEAELLKIVKGDPLMLERRLSFDEYGRPVEYGKDLYRGDKFKFVTSDAKLTLTWQ
ncbi:MAG: GntR family transcriptional regulator [Cellvibrionaceae bacterium]|jgi:GntR family transcriptional regulator